MSVSKESEELENIRAELEKESNSLKEEQENPEEKVRVLEQERARAKCDVCGKNPCHHKWDDGDGIFFFCSKKCMKHAKNVTVPR